jgi:hypothetical protein
LFARVTFDASVEHMETDSARDSTQAPSCGDRRFLFRTVVRFTLPSSVPEERLGALGEARWGPPEELVKFLQERLAQREDNGLALV